MHRVSAVIPTYNRAHLVPRALESALSQIYSPLEVIVVDDHSSDETAAVLQSWEARDSRVRAVLQGVNQGPAGARNRGVAEARGDLVAFLDSDDRWHSDHLKACVEFLEARPQLDLVFADLRHVAEEGKFLDLGFLWRKKRIGQYLWADPERPEWFTFRVPEADVLLQDYVAPVQTTVIRRSTAAEFPFDVSILGLEDWDFFLRLARAGKRFGVIERVHCDCFIHEGNLLSNGRAALRECVEQSKIWIRLLKEPALTPPQRRLLHDRLAKLRLDEGYNHLREGNRSQALRAYWRSLGSRWSWSALKGLVSAIALPRVDSKAGLRD